MSDITYTREVEVSVSDLVDEVYYNENNGDLYVDLDTSVYRYSNVPVKVVDEFENADSAGRFYNTVIKRDFGPGEDLGSWVKLNYEEIEVEAKPETVRVSTEAVNSSIAVPATIHLGEPVVPATFSLKPFNDNGVAKVEGIERDYAVTFEVDGLAGRKTHRLKSDTVDNAVGAVLDLGKMLDLTFIVREVTITFE